MQLFWSNTVVFTFRLLSRPLRPLELLKPFTNSCSISAGYAQELAWKVDLIYIHGE